jgi:hypothetical protein
VTPEGDAVTVSVVGDCWTSVGCWVMVGMQTDTVVVPLLEMHDPFFTWYQYCVVAYCQAS